MTNPLAIIGYIGTNTNLTHASSLVNTELAAMGRILERVGYTVRLAHQPFERSRPSKLPLTGLIPWDGEGEVDLVWCHQSPPNFFGGPTEEHCEQIGMLGDALMTTKRVWRLLVDNNETMRHNAIYGLRRNNACPGFTHCLEGFERVLERGDWYEVGWETCRDLDANLPFIDCGITAEQLKITSELLGGPDEKEYDFCYVGTSRANKKKGDRRLSLIEPFLSHEPSFYCGSLFKKRGTFRKCWDGMRRSKGQLIVRDPSMVHLPLHRYVQSLIHESVPIVLGEAEEINFIHDPELQKILRVSTYDEGLSLISRREELLPLLRKELEYWMDYDLARLPTGKVTS